MDASGRSGVYTTDAVWPSVELTTSKCGLSDRGTVCLQEALHSAHTLELSTCDQITLDGC